MTIALLLAPPPLLQDTIPVSGLSIPVAGSLAAVGILIYALVNSIEIAVVAANPIRLRQMAEGGSSGARSLLRLRRDQDLFFATIVLLQNLAVVLASSMASILALEAAGGAGLLASTVLTTLLLAVIGEFTPKVLAARASERYAVVVARPVEGIVRLLTPAVRVLALIPHAMSRVLFGEQRAVTPTVTEAELRMLMRISAEEGSVEEQEAALLERVFHFHDRRVNEVMIPRTEVVWLERDSRIRDYYEVFQQSPRTRFPVFNETPDNVVGIVGIKDVMMGLARSRVTPESPISSVMRPALFVPETMYIGALFYEMRRSRNHMAIVVDEYGGTSGIVTLETLLEEMVGQVADELATPEQEFQKIGEEQYDVDGGMSVFEIRADLGIDIPEGAYETIAGYVLEQLGHIPVEGEVVTGNGFRVAVASVKGVKIERVVITKTDTETG